MATYLQPGGGGLAAQAEHRLLHLLSALGRVGECLQAALGALAQPLCLTRYALLVDEALGVVLVPALGVGLELVLGRGSGGLQPRPASTNLALAGVCAGRAQWPECLGNCFPHRCVLGELRGREHEGAREQRAAQLRECRRAEEGGQRLVGGKCGER